MRSRIVFLSLVSLGLLTFAWAAAGKNPVSPYPGGSPFPPGKEPSPTHVAKVYWTTADGIMTRIDVEAPGERPTQLAVTKAATGKERPKTIHTSIHPKGTHYIRIASEKQDRQAGVMYVTAEGSGTVTLRIHGWDKKDFANPPMVVARYLKGSRIVGETSVETKPIPAKLAGRATAAGGQPVDPQRLASARKKLLGKYRGEVRIPDELLVTYARFVAEAKSGGVADSVYLPNGLSFTYKPRPEKTREHAQDINIPFLRKHFDGRILNLRKDGDGCYLIRTGTTALWFVQTKSLGWRLYRYIDKPIH